LIKVVFFHYGDVTLLHFAHGQFSCSRSHNTCDVTLGKMKRPLLSYNFQSCLTAITLQKFSATQSAYKTT